MDIIKETAFIRGNLTFWKCNYCNGWHESVIHQCPIKKYKEAIVDKIKKFEQEYMVTKINGKNQIKFLRILDFEWKEFKEKELGLEKNEN